MPRRLMLLAVALVIVPVASSADVTSTVAVEQRAFIYGNPDGQEGGSYEFNATNRIESDGDVVSQAYASVRTCLDPAEPWNCTWASYGPTIVSPTALRFDPAGNSGTFRATLQRHPSTPGPDGVFELTFAKPDYLGLCYACGSFPNAWVAPDGSAAGASASQALFVTRYSYEVTGTFAGAPLPPQPDDYTDNGYETQIFTSASAELP